MHTIDPFGCADGHQRIIICAWPAEALSLVKALGRSGTHLPVVGIFSNAKASIYPYTGDWRAHLFAARCATAQRPADRLQWQKAWPEPILFG